MFTQLAGKACFVNYLPRLTQATSDDGEPTPGYLLDEITKITFQSESASHQLVDYLLHRLNKSSTPVKIKVLKIIICVINNGHSSFRKQLRQDDGAIKSAVLHSGPPDPLLGTTLYKDVQKIAQEALDALFDPETIKEEESDTLVMTSMESSIFMGGMGASANSGGKYEGFGNTVKEREGTVTDKMLDYLGRLIHPSDEQKSEVIRAALHSSPGDYQPVAVAGALIDPVYPAEIQTSQTSFIKNHVPGRAGGGWESDEDEQEEQVTKQQKSSLAAETAVADLQSDATNSIQNQTDNPSKDSILVEAQEMLSKYSMSVGLPSIDELDAVCTKCAIFGCSQILKALPKVIPTFTGSSYKDGLMRILLLWEWLFHFDCSTQQVLSNETSEILDMVVNDIDLPAPCRSKAKKLKVLHEKCQNISCDDFNSLVISVKM